MSVQIRRLTGSTPGTGDDITNSNTRLLASDTHTISGTSNAVRIPSSGTNYSYKCSLQLYYDGSGTGTVDNIRWFTDGVNSLGTGIGLQVKTSSVYSQATGTEGVSGDEMTGGSDGFSYLESSPLTISGSVTGPSNELFADILEKQITVDSNADNGVSGQETGTYRYDSTIA